MTVIVTFNGPFGAISPDIRRHQAILGQYRVISGDIGAILGNIGQYWAISKYIGVLSSSVKSVMYWARPIQVVPGQFFF